MRIKHHTWISLAGLLVIAANGLASEATITHTFTSGTPAKADEVNQNFSDIKTAVDDNNSRISSNSTATASNASAITSNTTAINSHSTSIAGNTGAINTLSTAVSANSTNIDSLNNMVGTNSTELQSLDTAVTSNTAAINSNTSTIESNTARITTNETALSSLNQAVSIYEGTDNRLGRFLGVANRIDSNYTKLIYQGTIVWLLSDTGYLFGLERWYSPTTSTLRSIDYFRDSTSYDNLLTSSATLYYKSTNCTGQEYLSATEIDDIAYTGFSPVISVRGGIVFRILDMSGTDAASYLPKGTSSIPIAYYSSRNMNSTTCTANAQTLLEFALPISPNDPAVTGVSNTTTYTGRLTFGY